MPDATVTRMEILEHVEGAFGHGGPVTRDELLEAAVRSHAPPKVLEQLLRLPQRRFRSVRDLWVELYDVPVG